MAVKIIAQDPKILANLSGVAFANCCDGVAVGANGTVITTNDGGVSWISQASGFAGGFRDVAFVGETMVAVGDECAIVRSTNGGTIWSAPTTVPSFTDPAQSMLSGVSFRDENIGYAVGAAIDGVDGIQKALVLTTNTGGDTWSSPQFVLPESADGLVDVDFSVISDVTYVVAVGTGTTGIGGLIIRAEIGTTNWSIPPVLPSRTSTTLFGVAFAKAPYAQHGWAVGGEGAIVHTTDGGATWTVQTSGVSNDEILLRVAAIDDKHAWAVSISGSLIATSDGGENWIQQDTGTGQQLWDLMFCSPCLGTIVGASGTILTVLGQS